MGLSKISIGIVPAEGAPEILAKTVSAHLAGYFSLSTHILPPLVPPDYAYNEKRNQYDAGAILKRLESEQVGKDVKVIALLDVDLFVPILTHVFGEARQGGKCALVSTFRLGPRTGLPAQPDPLLLERTSKVALHEAGHLFRLLHCEDETCLMHFSGGLEDLDRTPLFYCRYCTTYFRDALRRLQTGP